MIGAEACYHTDHRHIGQFQDLSNCFIGSSYSSPVLLILVLLLLHLRPAWCDRPFYAHDELAVGACPPRPEICGWEEARVRLQKGGKGEVCGMSWGASIPPIIPSVGILSCPGHKLKTPVPCDVGNPTHGPVCVWCPWQLIASRSCMCSQQKGLPGLRWTSQGMGCRHKTASPTPNPTP